MKINKPHSKFKHVAIAVSVVFGLAACSSDDGPIAINPPPPQPAPVNVSPVVSSSAVTSAEESVLYTYTFTATDADAGDTLTLASATLPGWLTFDVATGVLSGTPAAADVGANAVSLSVTDGTDTVTQDFTITVAAAPFVNTAPVFSSTAVIVGDEDTAYSYTATATDADANDTLVLASVTLPAWLTFDVATGVLSGTPAAADVGASAVSLSVTDGTDTVTQDFTITVAAAPFVNTAPVFNSTVITMGTVGTAYSYTATATDADANDTLSFSSVTLPAWAMFDTSTAVLSGTPDMAGDYPVELMVTDGTDAASQAFTITVAADDSVTVALSVFENAVLPEWAPWISAGGSTAVVTDDADHDQAVQFNLTEASVAGFTARDGDGAVGGMPFDASGVTNAMFSFELKMIKAPDAGVVDWKLKLEGGGTAAEVSLSTAVEAHATPVLDTWQTYTFPLASLGGLNLSTIDLFMVFPNFNDAKGTEFLIDNMMIVEGDEVDEPEPEVTVALNVFEDAVLPEWAPWINEAGSTAVVTDDAEHAQAVQFNLTNPSVAGFTARDADGAVGGMPFDASGLTNAMFTFELKMIKAPDAGVVDWKLKLEGGGTAAEVNLSTATEAHATPVLDTWQTYTFPLASLGGLNLSAIDLFMVFPNFNDAKGAEFLLDNVMITAGGQSEDPGPVGGTPDVMNYGDVTNGGFETNSLDGWLAGNGVSVLPDDMGTYLVKIVAAEAENQNIYQDRIGEGVYTAGQALTVSFDMRGTAVNGGVVSALLTTIDPTTVSKTEELLPLALNENWTTYTFNVTAGDPIGWGVALRLGAVCGAVGGCAVEAYFDNIVITAN